MRWFVHTVHFWVPPCISDAQESTINVQTNKDKLTAMHFALMGILK